MRALSASRPLRRTASIVAVLFTLAVIGGQTAGADTKSELEAARAKLHDLEAQISDQQAHLKELRADGAVLAAKLDGVQSAIAETQAAIAKLQHDVEVANEKLRKVQTQLDRRAWVAYEGGPGSSFEFLLGSTSLGDFSSRLEIVNRAAQSDRDLIDEVQDRRAALQAKTLEKQRAEKLLIGQREELEQQQQALSAKADAVQAAVADLNTKKAEADKLVSQLDDKLIREREAARLARLAAAPTVVSGGGGGGGGGGAVAGHPFETCPVQGGIYSDDFGAPRYGGGYHAHAGNDLFASRGTPIRAPFGGTAVDASNGLGGLSVKVYGAAGWVYNAHLDSVGQLGAVSAGTVIGYVGDSGDAKGGATHDHFEWHPAVVPANPWTSPYGVSQVGDAIDPYPYLNQVC